MQQIKRKYNWVKDKPDVRDFKYKVVHPYKATALPASYNLKAYCPPIVDQGQIGSCTGNALAGAYGFISQKQLRQNVTNGSAEFNDTQFIPTSRLFIYWNERVIEGDPYEDNGAELRDGIKSMSQTGVCSEHTWGYSDNLLFIRPYQSAFAEAANHKISVYSRLNTLDDMKHCISSGYPFVFGFTVYEFFESEEMMTTGKLRMPQPGEQVVGGHAVMAVGYDDKNKWFTIRNSWGTDWGLNGLFHMPYDYISDMNLCSDFWTMRK